ncbi:MAG: hypothetical protein SynsKO_05300 [Synoicihabitans sp.]
MKIAINVLDSDRIWSFVVFIISNIAFAYALHHHSLLSELLPRAVSLIEEQSWREAAHFNNFASRAFTLSLSLVFATLALAVFSIVATRLSKSNSLLLLLVVALNYVCVDIFM